MGGLAEALAIKRGDCVALLGGGGKTTALYALVAELSRQGRVLVTTTTRIFYPPPAQVPRLVTAGSPAEARQALEESFRHGPLAGLGTRRDGEKLLGVPPEWLDELAPLADYCLVEADGAAGRPLKGYAPHEPVVPESATRVLALAGLDCLHKPLDAEAVHRPAAVAAVSGLGSGECISAVTIARALQAALARARLQAPAAQFSAVLNKEETPECRAAARRVATLLAGLGVPVLSGSLRQGKLYMVPPDLPVAAAVLLAAGEARRFGQPKLLLPYRGKTLLENALDNLLQAPLGQVVVVVGAGAREIRALLGDRPVEVVENPAYREGQAGSLQAGLQAVRPEAQAALFALADQPRVPPRVAEALLAGMRDKSAAVPAFAGQRGNPVLFSRALFPDLLGVSGDRGGRAVLAAQPDLVREVPVDCPGILEDVDLPEDYQRLSRE